MQKSLNIQSIFTDQPIQRNTRDHNRIVYRSNCSRKFMCIVTVMRILYITSEEFSIPYVNPIDRMFQHTYYPDFIIKNHEANDI